MHRTRASHEAPNGPGEAPRLVAPAPRAVIDPEWTVWAFADPSGVRTGLVSALQQALLVADDERWCGGPGVAVVGVGDYIDRGTDSMGLLRFLSRLSDEARAAGSRVVLVRGNHEQFAIEALAGDEHVWDIWLSNGGDATLRSAGVGPEQAGADLSALALSLQALHPWFLPMLRSMPLQAWWRDVCFVHGGLVADATPQELDGTRDSMLIGAEFFAGSAAGGHPFGHPVFGAYHRAGIGRVVVGHASHEAATTYQQGTILVLDTNASAAHAGEAHVTLARIPSAGRLDGDRRIVVDTSTAPDRMPARRRGGPDA